LPPWVKLEANLTVGLEVGTQAFGLLYPKDKGILYIYCSMKNEEIVGWEVVCTLQSISESD